MTGLQTKNQNLLFAVVTCEVDTGIFLARNSFGGSGTLELTVPSFACPSSNKDLGFLKVDLIFGNCQKIIQSQVW